MSVKVTVPNTSSDSVVFGSANTPTAAEVVGIDSGSSNGQLAFKTTASGTSTERMRIDASGNVGIGTSSPTTKITIASASDGKAVNLVNGSGNTSLIQFGSNAIPADAYTYIKADGRSTGYLTVSTNDTERMRIDSSGYTYINTTSQISGVTSSAYLVVNSSVSDYTFGVQNTNATPYGAAIKYSTTPNSTGSQFLYCADGTAQRASIRSNGGLANYSANNANLSDERLKTDITPAKSYLDTICAIPVVTFKYNDQTDDELNLGVIAQDVDAVASELVDHSGFGETPEGEDPYLAVYQTDLQYALMKCIQELKQELDTVKAELTALKGA